MRPYKDLRRVSCQAAKQYPRRARPVICYPAARGCSLPLVGGADLTIKTSTHCSSGDRNLNIETLVALTVFLGFNSALSPGQTTVAASSQKAIGQPIAGGAESKQWKFAVVSIRKNNSGGPVRIGVATADGYQMKNMFLGYLFLSAYSPQAGGAAFYSVGQIVGMPAWLEGNDDRYVVDAKVDDVDLADWQNPAKQPAMLRSMLQALLEGRLKLVVHRSTREAPVYRLVVGKNGPKFKETNPGEPHPGARPLPRGGTFSREQNDDWMRLHYFGISIAQLASFELGDAGRTIEDQTGLAGRYDFTIEMPVPQPGTQQGGTAMPGLGPSAFSIADQLGLKLEPAKGQVETLVIDHVERPSPN